jgi:hypothetical protein
LTHDLNLLSSVQQKVDWHACDSGHFGVVEQAAELFHKPQRQLSILDTIHSQSFSGVFSTFEQLKYFCVMDVFFLVVKDFIGHVVESVR